MKDRFGATRCPKHYNGHPWGNRIYLCGSYLENVPTKVFERSPSKTLYADMTFYVVRNFVSNFIIVIYLRLIRKAFTVRVNCIFWR